jgi:hypothetical protein
MLAITIPKTVVIAVIEDYWESHLKNGSKQDLKLHGLGLSLSFSRCLSLALSQVILILKVHLKMNSITTLYIKVMLM